MKAAFSAPSQKREGKDVLGRRFEKSAARFACAEARQPLPLVAAISKRLKRGVFADKGEGHAADRAVSLFSDDNLRLAFLSGSSLW